ncbi:hypothetical protein [Paenisporosarcina sp. NPDC076898]|uniref:hypothetical protein n=1 Tax=unclassified Paenisporosarcina TaxID=2642018 RepID=UPI003CFE007F
MKSGSMYVDEGKKIGATNYVAIVQFDDGVIRNHSFTNYSYEDVFKAIVEIYKSEENEKSVLRVLIEKR